MNAQHAAKQSGVAWQPLIVVLAVIALLTGGWTLVSAPLSDTEPVSAGTSLEVGPGGVAEVTVADGGWQLSRAATDLDEIYALTRGDVDLSIRHVPLLSEPSPEELWSAFQKTVRASGGTLGEPSAMTTQSGQSGQSGSLQQEERSGTAYAVPAPDGTFAVEFTVLGGSDAAAADLSSAEQVVPSLTFQDGGS